MMSALDRQMHCTPMNANHTPLLIPSHSLVTMWCSFCTECQTSLLWYHRTMYGLCPWFLIQCSLQFCKWGRWVDSLISSNEVNLVGFWMASELGLPSRNNNHLLELWNAQPLPSKCPWKGVGTKTQLITSGQLLTQLCLWHEASITANEPMRFKELLD